jgi:acyl-CoA synthetase (AMP-forming)/AMP-acid ligase II
MLLSDALRHTAYRRPGHAAVIDENTSLDFSRLQDRSNRLGNAIAGGLGLCAGDRFAVLAQNRAEFVELVFGGASAGAVCAPLNYRLAGPEIAEILEDAQARALIVDPAYAETVEALRAGGFDGEVVWLSGAEEPQGEGLLYEDLLREASAALPDAVAAAGEDDVMLQMYTSGTTGRPKGVMLTHRSLLACSWSHLAERTVVPSDRYLTTTPLCHLGAASRIWLLVLAGATHTLRRKFDAEEMVTVIRDEKVTNTHVVPAQVRQVVDAAKAIDGDIRGCLRLIVYGTSRMPVELLTEALETLACDFMQGYGLTEASPNLTILPPADHLPLSTGEYSPRLGTVGREAIGVHVRVVDGEDNDLPPGEVGNVIARGDNVMAGYWRRPEETAATLHGGWLRTGDLGTIDAEGYLSLVGRSKDMLISGGINVYPAEVERQLEQHPDVGDAAVVGKEDERWGEVPVAFVTVTGESEDDAVSERLGAFLGERLARFKQPKQFRVLAEMPRNSMGKVDKTRLKEMVSEDAAPR